MEKLLINCQSQINLKQIEVLCIASVGGLTRVNMLQKHFQQLVNHRPKCLLFISSGKYDTGILRHILTVLDMILYFERYDLQCMSVYGNDRWQWNLKDNYNNNSSINNRNNDVRQIKNACATVLAISNDLQLTNQEILYIDKNKSILNHLLTTGLCCTYCVQRGILWVCVHV